MTDDKVLEPTDEQIDLIMSVFKDAIGCGCCSESSALSTFNSTAAILGWTVRLKHPIRARIKDKDNRPVEVLNYDKHEVIRA